MIATDMLGQNVQEGETVIHIKGKIMSQCILDKIFDNTIKLVWSGDRKPYGIISKNPDGNYPILSEDNFENLMDSLNNR